MVISPAIINKIKKIVFQRAEPHDLTVMWAKPFGNSFTFFIYVDGVWQSLELYDNVEISVITGDISVFNNDAGYVTEQDLGDYAKTTDIPTDFYSQQQVDDKDAAIRNAIPSVDAYFDDAEYDSQNIRINFKHSGVVKAYIDATAFIKDGMVDKVEIKNGNLVITFNTDAGKETVTIPLTDIFDPSNYYTKTQVDDAIAVKYTKPNDGIPSTDMTAAVRTSLGKADTALQEHQDISGKADKVANATQGHLAALDSHGNLVDSTKSASDFDAAGAAAAVAIQCANTYVKKVVNEDGPVYIGSGATIEDVILDPQNEYDNLQEKFVIGCSGDYIYFLWPASNDWDVELMMSNMLMPMEELSPYTIDSTVYTVLRTEETYNFAGTIRVRALQNTV